MEFSMNEIKKYRKPGLMGALVGLLNSTIAYSIFWILLSLEILAASGRFHYVFDFFQYGFIAFLYGEAIIFIPSMIGGSLLAIWLSMDHEHGHLRVRMAFVKGASSGTMIAFGLCYFIYMYIGRYGDFDLFLFHSLEVSLLGFVAGGSGAVILTRWIQKMHRMT